MGKQSTLFPEAKKITLEELEFSEAKQIAVSGLLRLDLRLNLIFFCQNR